MSLSPQHGEARQKVLGILADQGLESYVAYEPGSGREWCSVVQADYVVPEPDLVAAWSAPGAGIAYHHAHPDDRALSPSDLRALYNPGLAEVWAHGPGAAYGARLHPGVDVAAFEAAHEHLNGVIGEDMAREFIEAQAGAGALSEETYIALSDRAFCQALDKHGVLSVTALDAAGTPLAEPSEPVFELLVVLAQAVLDRCWPLPPVT